MIGKTYGKIEWNTLYNTGIVKIDTQHQKLVSIINNLVDSYDLNKSRSEIEAVFLGLVNYCNYHFTTEEQVMQDHSYIEYDVHKYQHDIFFNKIDEYKIKFSQGSTAALLSTVEYLNSWLIDHIMVEDRKYIPYLFEKFK